MNKDIHIAGYEESPREVHIVEYEPECCKRYVEESKLVLEAGSEVRKLVERKVKEAATICDQPGPGAVLLSPSIRGLFLRHLVYENIKKRLDPGHPTSFEERKKAALATLCPELLEIFNDPYEFRTDKWYASGPLAESIIRKIRKQVGKDWW